MAKDRTGNGLRMKAPVCRIAILRLAGFAQGERGHGGGGAVIRNRTDDAETRTAMGAVGEGIAEAPVGGAGDLFQAGWAYACVRRYLGVNATASAFDNEKAGRKGCLAVHRFDAFDLGQRRRFPPQGLDQRAGLVASARDADQNALAVIHHLTIKRKGACMAPDRRPEADPLDAPAHADFARPAHPLTSN